MIWLRIAVPVAVLAAVWHLFDGRAALERLRDADWRWLLLGGVALHLQTVLSALRWRLTAARLGMQMPVSTATSEYYLTQFVNQTVPGGVVGDAARAVRARHSAGLRRSGTAVLIERVLGQIALLAVMLAGFSVAPLWPGGVDWPVWTGGLAGALLLAAPLLWRSPSLPTAFRDTVRPAWPAQSALGLAIVGCNLTAFAAAARATGTALAPDTILTLIPLILFAMLLPLSVAGWGWREGAAAALFPLAGAAPEAGLAASVTFGLLMLAAALPGALWLVPVQGRV